MLFLESAPAMKFNLGLVAKLQHTVAVFLAAANVAGRSSNESLLTMITARFLLTPCQEGEDERKAGKCDDLKNFSSCTRGHSSPR